MSKLKKPIAAIKAKEIINLLSVKHQGDVFVTECKHGPSPSPRLDVWAMTRSWSQPYVHGYEVKVSRADFLKDDKMAVYLPMCNLMSIVCPWGMIQPNEIPDKFGLFYVTKTGTRLYTKVKPPHRDVKIPENVFRYVLMARSEIKSEFVYGKKDLTYWKEWLAQKEESRSLGLEVKTQIAKTATNKIFEIEKESSSLKWENSKLAEVKKILDDLGISSGQRI